MKKILKLLPFMGILLVCSLFIGCNDDDDKSTEALILEMTFEEEVVTTQPVIKGTDINFSVAHHTTEEQLKELKPMIKISSGATVSPESGSTVDFTTENVEFIVTAEDGVTTTKYTVSCKKSINTEAKILDMKFEASDIVTGSVVIEDTNIIIPIKGNTPTYKLRKLVPTIEVSGGAILELLLGTEDEVVAYEEGMEIDFSKAEFGNDKHQPIRFLVTAEDGVTQATYSVYYTKNTNTEASLISFSLTSPVITKEPIVDGANFIYEISNEATLNDLNKLIPKIEVSEYATISPAIGDGIDFSRGNVTFEIIAGDGKTKTKFHVYMWQSKFGFENWFVENPENESSVQFLAPIAGWSSSNTGAALLMGMTGDDGKPFADRYVVTQAPIKDAKSGNSAARIETVDTKGKFYDLGFLKINIPKVTTGTLFLGKFVTDINNTLNSTKFGMPYYKKPLRVRGYYKYTPGNEFYRATGMSDCHIPSLEEKTTDECAINAILYEVENEDDAYLTGANAYDENNGKLVARAELKDGTAKSDYTSFDLEFEYKYGKTYDPNKKYRLAIICASSKWGDTFSGAPGSVLYVDDIEIISE